MIKHWTKYSNDRVDQLVSRTFKKTQMEKGSSDAIRGDGGGF